MKRRAALCLALGSCLALTAHGFAPPAAWHGAGTGFGVPLRTATAPARPPPVRAGVPARELLPLTHPFHVLRTAVHRTAAAAAPSAAARSLLARLRLLGIDVHKEVRAQLHRCPVHLMCAHAGSG